MNEVVKEFGLSGTGKSEQQYSHPQADAVLAECQDLLGKIPEGRRLLELARSKNYAISVITGPKPDYIYMSPTATQLVCPLNTKAVDLPEMAVCMGLAIRDLEQPSVGIPRAVPAIHQQSLPQVLYKQLLDISIEMCKIVGEFYDVDNNTKLVDLLEKLGHGNLYRGFRSGKTQEELAKIYSVSITR